MPSASLDQSRELGQAYGLVCETGDDRSHRRKRPQRRGFYVAEVELRIDPVRKFLESLGAEFEAASDLRPWLADPEATWCWVRVATPAFVQELLASVSATDAGPEKGPQRLSVMLPGDAPDAVRKALHEARIVALAEPWNTGALEDVLTHLRSVRGTDREPVPAAATSG